MNIGDKQIAYPPTPELDKQREIIKSGQASTVQDFIDWFRQQHLELLVYETRPCEDTCPGPDFFTPHADGKIYPGTHKEAVCQRCKGTNYVSFDREGYYSDGRRPETLMANFFGIDENKIESERRAILEAIRS